jgi:hypothetical protein
MAARPGAAGTGILWQSIADMPNSFEEPDVQVLVDKLLTQRPNLDD